MHSVGRSTRAGHEWAHDAAAAGSPGSHGRGPVRGESTCGSIAVIPQGPSVCAGPLALFQASSGPSHP